MENDLSEKLKNVLSDPSALAKISAIANSLGGGGNSKTESAQEPKEEQPAERENFSLPVLPSFQSDPRLALLSSLKPLLKEDKRGKIDSLTRALTIATMMKTYRK